MATTGAAHDSSLAWDETAVRTSARNRTFMLPDVVSERLDALVEHLDVVAVRTNRAELVGALLLDTKADTQHLEQLLRRYRLASVADAHLGDQHGERLQLHAPAPGPRPRT